MNSIKENIQALHGLIITAAERYGRTASAITLLAVSKAQPVSAIAAAYDAGQRCFGENYVQEALVKIQTLSEQNIEWHFIGHIQTNKAATIAKHFDWVHSVENLTQAKKLSAYRGVDQSPLNILIQVNIDQETTKSGINLDELQDLATAIIALPRLQLRGLMAIPAFKAELSEQRATFAKLRKAFETLKKDLPLDTLSMGMSQDYEAAIAEGATIIRIGTAIFGERTT